MAALLLLSHCPASTGTCRPPPPLHQRVWERYIYEFQHDYPPPCSSHMPGRGGRGPVEAGRRQSNRRAGKGDQTWGTIGQTNELQLLVNQEARAMTGCFRTTKLGGVWLLCRNLCPFISLLVAGDSLVGGAPPDLDGDTRPCLPQCSDVLSCLKCVLLAGAQLI